MNPETLQKAINYFGIDRQVDKSIEEMAELTKELLKYKHGSRKINELKSELADVKIMIAQLELIYGNVDNEVEFKINRLGKLIGG